MVNVNIQRALVESGIIVTYHLSLILLLVIDLFSSISLQISIPLSTGLLLCPSNVLVGYIQNKDRCR